MLPFLHSVSKSKQNSQVFMCLCVSILMLFFAIKRMNTKIGEAIFILHVQVLFEYQMEKRIKKLCYFN